VKTFIRTIIVFVVVTLVMVGHNAPAEGHGKINVGREPTLTKEERIFGLVTIYRAAKQHFAMFEQVPDLDWDQTFIDFLPLVGKKQSLLEYYQTLRRFAVLLQDGHTFVSLPDSIYLSQLGDLPLNLDYVEEQWVVIERLPTKEIIEEDIPPGAVVLAIQGVPAADYTEMLEDKILYVRYGSCSKGIEKAFSKLIESMELTPPEAMILDLRGNVGGSTPIKTVRHLISRPVKQYFFKTPCSISYVDARMQAASEDGQSREEIANEIFEDFPEYTPDWYSFSSSDIEPAEKYYNGPVVLLTNRVTASAAEDLVVMLQGNNRAAVIGEPTSGTTGQPIFFDLPGGGRVQVCTCLCRYPDGRSFVGVGVQPDVLVKRTIKGIANGRDEVIEAAIDYLHSVKDANQVNQIQIERSKK